MLHVHARLGFFGWMSTQLKPLDQLQVLWGVTYIAVTKVLKWRIPLAFSRPFCVQRSGFQEERGQKWSCVWCLQQHAAAAESTAQSRALCRLSDKTLAASIHRHHNHRGAKNRGIYSMQWFRSSAELLLFTIHEVGPHTPDPAVLSCTIIQKRIIFIHSQRVFLQRTAAFAAAGGVKF